MSKKNLSIKELRYQLQKLSEDRSFRFPRLVSIYITKFFILYTRFTPNQITVMWILVTVVTSAMLAVGEVWSLLTVPFLIQVYYILDCVDGEVARYTRIKSRAGKKLDQYGHAIFDNLSIIGVTVGSYMQTGNPLCFYLGLALFFGFNMVEKLEYIIRTSLKQESKGGAGSDEESAVEDKPARKISLMTRISNALEYIPYKGMHVIVLLGVFDQMLIGLAVWALVFNLKWIKSTSYWVRNMNNSLTMVFLTLEPEFHEKLRFRCNHQGLSLLEYIQRILIENEKQAAADSQPHGAPDTSVNQPQ